MFRFSHKDGAKSTKKIMEKKERPGRHIRQYNEQYCIFPAMHIVTNSVLRYQRRSLF